MARSKAGGCATAWVIYNSLLPGRNTLLIVIVLTLFIFPRCSELILLFLFVLTEIDPCIIDHGGCSINAVCTKVSPGERTCVCKEGYAGDGTLCLGECSVHVLMMVARHHPRKREFQAKSIKISG